MYVVYVLPTDAIYVHLEDHNNVEYPLWFFLLDKVWLMGLIIWSLYFLCAEVSQAKKQGWSYLKDVWNYTDMIPPALIIIIVVVDFFVKEETETITKFRTTLQAFASFGMWLKIFYFLRIFRQTGFFVNMLISITKSSTVFFLLYLLILCSFGCSFYIMSPVEKGLLWHLDYTYMLGLGEFDEDVADSETPHIMHFFFLVATLLVMIVMLNLLIAIVSTAYEKVIES